MMSDIFLIPWHLSYLSILQTSISTSILLLLAEVNRSKSLTLPLLTPSNASHSILRVIMRISLNWNHCCASSCWFLSSMGEWYFLFHFWWTYELSHVEFLVLNLTFRPNRYHLALIWRKRIFSSNNNRSFIRIKLSMHKFLLLDFQQFVNRLMNRSNIFDSVPFIVNRENQRRFCCQQ